MKTRKVYSLVIKDMMESGIDPSLLITNRLVIEQLNIELDIPNSVEVKVKVKQRPKPKKVFRQPNLIVKPSISYRRSVIVNPDGTISMSFEEWDYE